jgi:hypothetical protein
VTAVQSRGRRRNPNCTAVAREADSRAHQERRWDAHSAPICQLQCCCTYFCASCAARHRSGYVRCRNRGGVASICSDTVTVCSRECGAQRLLSHVAQVVTVTRNLHCWGESRAQHRARAVSCCLLQSPRAPRTRSPRGTGGLVSQVARPAGAALRHLPHPHRAGSGRVQRVRTGAVAMRVSRGVVL